MPTGSPLQDTRQARPPTDELDLPIALHVVEGHGYAGGLSVQHRELAPVRLPGKGNDGLCGETAGHRSGAAVLTLPKGRRAAEEPRPQARGPQRLVGLRLSWLGGKARPLWAVAVSFPTLTGTRVPGPHDRLPASRAGGWALHILLSLCSPPLPVSLSSKTETEPDAGELPPLMSSAASCAARA